LFRVAAWCRRRRIVSSLLRHVVVVSHFVVVALLLRRHRLLCRVMQVHCRFDATNSASDSPYRQFWRRYGMQHDMRYAVSSPESAIGEDSEVDCC